jgi:hypothetical protein
LAITDHFRVRALPVKVPVMSFLRPSDGNEPAYLVGMWPTAASATAAIESPPAANAKARTLIISHLPCVNGLSEISQHAGAILPDLTGAAKYETSYKPSAAKVA